MNELANKAWFEKYRPETFEEIIFPDENKEFLIKKFIDQGYVQGNIISYGPGGTGKTTVSKVLQNLFIKHKSDMFILGRSVESIDELSSWLLYEKTEFSKQKIVFCEEFDNLSSKALSVLKDGLLEKYQPKVSFIVTTNNIHKLDPALVQRFNIKLNFSTVNTNKLKYRLENILIKENISYQEDELLKFVDFTKNLGIRDIINNLQIASLYGKLNVNLIGSSSSGNIDDNLVNILVYLINYPTNLTLVDTQKLRQPENTPIKDYYEWITQMLINDPAINFDYVYAGLLKAEIILPLKNIIIDHYQTIDSKKFKYLHLLATLANIFEYWIKVKS